MDSWADRLRLLSGVVGLTAAVSVLWLLTWVTVVPIARGWTPVLITSGSMAPAISAGDIVVAQPSDGDDPVGLGAVVVFDNPAGDGFVTHRVVDVDVDGNYVTQGDANARVDSTPVRPETVRGVGRVLVPVIGTPVLWLAEGRWFHLSALLLVGTALLWAARWPFSSDADWWRSPATAPVVHDRPAVVTAGPLALLLAVALTAAGTTAIPQSDAAFGDLTANADSQLTVPAWKAILEIDGGLAHTCLTRAEGLIWCWGLNDQGQLGDGTKNDSMAPVEVVDVGGVGTLGGVVDLGAGAKHTCAAIDTGGVRCWGDNPDGQLGDGTKNDATTPVVVKGPGGTGQLAGVAAVAGGASHSCALKSDGSVWCWGRNDKGQLGNGTTTDSLAPVAVAGSSAVVAIAAGAKFTCAVKTDGSVWCWGDNPDGQLGDGSTAGAAIPVQVKGVGGSGVLSDRVGVAAGESFACALDSAGSVACWGRNDKGQLGNGTTGGSQVPVAVGGAGSSGGVDLAAGLKHACVARIDGTAWCWGLNDHGQLGDGTTVDSLSPVQVIGVGGTGTLTDVTLVAAGATFSCAALSDWTARCWGRNDKGQLGDNTTDDSMSPVQVKGAGWSGVFEEAVSLDGGGAHTCAVKSDGAAWCWGRNDKGQLGNATTSDSLVPVLVRGQGGTGALSGVVSVAAGSKFACALVADGSVWCWGENNKGQLGDGTTTNSASPVPVRGVGGAGTLSNVVAIAAGELFACAVDSAGVTVCWGLNNKGQLGNGTTNDSSLPVAVGGAGASGVVDVAAGLEHTCGVKSDGSAWCWGLNNEGQLGNGTRTDSASPVRVVGVGGVGSLAGVVSAAAGSVSTCAVRTDTTVACWGRNDKGQLGDNTTIDSTRPVVVTGSGGVGTLTSITSVAAGLKHACAETAGGGLWCWGHNNKGQLGDGTTTDRLSPVPVVHESGAGTIADATAVGTGSIHSCTVRADTTVWCWGDNPDGQLGDGTTDGSARPVQVL